MSDEAQTPDIETTPVGFSEVTLGLGLYDWQAEVLTWFEDTSQLVLGSLCTPNGAGKSQRIVASLALWWVTIHKRGRVVITTKDAKQLDHQVWVALESHRTKFPSYKFIEREIHTPTGGFIIGFTTDEPGRAEGWHKEDDVDGPLLVICDEAKSIADAIFEAIYGRCTYNAILYVSSPGLTEGEFYKSQTDPKLAFDPETGKGIRRMKVGLLDCPHIPQARIDNILLKYGPDHWLTRSTLYGEFTESDGDALFIFQRAQTRTAFDHPPVYVHGDDTAFCDFAAGRNENVLAHKRGNRVEIVAWRDTDPMRAIARFILEFRARNLVPGKIFGDAGGMGIPILARFKELGWPLIGVNNDGDPNDPSRYESIGAEMWNEAALKTMRGELIPPAGDEILFEQLCTRRAKPVGDGIIGNEPKKEHLKRGLESPDRGDAYVGVACAEAQLASQLFDAVSLAKLDAMALLGRDKAEVTALDLEDGKIVHRPRAEHSWCRVWERPIIGKSYLLVVSPFPHSDLTGTHVISVIRKGYAEGENPVSNKLVATLIPARVDAGPLCTMVESLARWYGNARVVPVVHDRGDVIESLRNRGLHIYMRKDFEVRKGGHGQQRKKVGWEIDEYTRSLWIGSLIDGINTDMIEVPDQDTVMQLHQLRADNADTMRCAEALGVGLRLIELATVYSPRQGPARTDFVDAAALSGSMFG